MRETEIKDSAEAKSLGTGSYLHFAFFLKTSRLAHAHAADFPFVGERPRPVH